MSKLREYLEERDTGTVWASEALKLLTEEEGEQKELCRREWQMGYDGARLLFRGQFHTLREQVSRITDTLDDAHNSENCHTQHSCYYGVANAIMELRAAVSIGEAK